MKRSVFFNNTRTTNNDNALLRCFGTDPTLFRTTAALRWWGPEVDMFSVNSTDKR